MSVYKCKAIREIWFSPGCCLLHGHTKCNRFLVGLWQQSIFKHWTPPRAIGCGRASTRHLSLQVTHRQQKVSLAINADHPENWNTALFFYSWIATARIFPSIKWYKVMRLTLGVTFASKKFEIHVSCCFRDVFPPIAQTEASLRIVLVDYFVRLSKALHHVISIFLKPITSVNSLQTSLYVIEIEGK